MDSKPMEIHLKNVACCLGAIQALAYGILSLICIILYNTATPDYTPETYMQYVNTYMYSFFVGPNVERFVGQTFTPGVFTGFIWVHLILNILWISASIQTFLGKGFSLERNLRTWSLITAAVCIWDFLTVVIIGTDYGKCLHFFNENYPANVVFSLQVMCASGLLSVMVIAAKGFILWIVNAIFAALLFKMSRQTRTGNKPTFHNMPSTLQQQYGINPSQVEYSPYPSGPAPSYSRPTNVSADYIVPIPEPDYDRPSSHPTRRM